jgi:hypothetical protein
MQSALYGAANTDAPFVTSPWNFKIPVANAAVLSQPSACVIVL